MNPTHTRRELLAALGVAGAAGVAGCSAPNGGNGADGSDGGGGPAASTAAGTDPATTGAGTDAPADLPARVGTETLADGFASPVGVEFPPGADGRAYVADQRGRVFVADGETAPFLDVRDRMVDLPGGYSEMGLLGLAFHPEFPDDDRVFVRYSAPAGEATPSGYSHTFVLSSFSATPDAADPDSERVLLEIPEPQSNHNAGSVAFGPDGLLYVGVGDGGGANDRGTGHADDWYDAVAGGNGQDTAENLLGSVLRVDVDGGAGDDDGGAGDGDDGRPYGIPEGNPLVGREGLDEQYAWGFRNPWRFSFDRETGDFYVADVGQNRWEEVNRVVAGGNYGWNAYEGTHPFRADSAPETTPDGDPLRTPAVEYPHSGDGRVTGVTVIGGYVYRGDALSGLGGRYLFADWQTDRRLFVADPREGAGWPVSVVELGGLPASARVLSFGEDPDGELYVCTAGRDGGAVRRLAGVDA
ncbi:PQQ-dependent sugar dehydrogenase [Candidatus Halobonum tyrrellensis]|uniref:PQQ-dependent sugar dehydrogenase n=1 Tax=Candidatus Halobonum tyrrellensis TaxID=1431545 RepID=UPI00067775D1|nr:PQQ-dependent sugar dehydrogenase [Candidatus Halobonum tyrrellensis]